jgi:hypothetical protein
VPTLIRSAALNAIHSNKRWIDGFSKIANDYKVRDRKFFTDFAGWRKGLDFTFTDGDIIANPLDPPELVARFPLQRHQLAFTHRQPGQAYCFRKMFLEHKTRNFRPLQCLYFAGDGFSQPFVRYLVLSNLQSGP